jgi:hypothetical protein
VPEIIDPVFAKTSPKRPFCMTENELFRFFFRDNWVYKFGGFGFSDDQGAKSRIQDADGD